MKMLLLVLIFCLIGGNFAQTIGFGVCPNVNTVSPFDISKYAGLWYENLRSIPNLFEFGGKCVTANYSANNDGTLKVVNQQISWITGLESTIVGTAAADVSECGNITSCSKLVVEFPIPVIGKTQGKYWVLDTDYTSYSIVWSCSNFFLNHVKFLWLLTREQIPPVSLIQKADNIMTQYGVADIPTMTTDQKNCP